MEEGMNEELLEAVLSEFHIALDDLADSLEKLGTDNYAYSIVKAIRNRNRPPETEADARIMAHMLEWVASDLRTLRKTVYRVEGDDEPTACRT